MKQFAARLMFVLAPALLFGLVGCIIHVAFGAMVFVALVGVGINATEARPERGEGACDER